MIRRWWHALLGFLAPVPGTIGGWLNAEEVARIAIVSLVAFVGGGGWQAFVSSILSDPDIWAPSAPPLVLTAAATAVEVMRRLHHDTARPPDGPGAIKIHRPDRAA